MKLTKKFSNTYLLLFTSILLLAQSCATVSISQRRYNRGIHIEWAGKGKLHQKQEALLEEKQTTATVYETPTVHLSSTAIENSEIAVQKPFKPFSKNTSYSPLAVAKKQGIFFKDNERESTITAAAAHTVKLNHSSKKQQKKTSDFDDPLWLLLIILLAILLPPAAIFLHEGGFTRNVMISIILVLLAILMGAGVSSGLFSLWGLAIIHAFWVIFFS